MKRALAAIYAGVVLGCIAFFFAVIGWWTVLTLALTALVMLAVFLGAWAVVG